jgi:excisionase family DNA binding protein
LNQENIKDIRYKAPTTQYSRQADNSQEESALIFNNLKWMTTNEAAAYLRKSTNALRTAVCRGHIKARKFRRRLYFKRSELDRLIETSSVIGG